MLSGIDLVHGPIKYRYITARLTGALVKCKSNDKESFGNCFSRPRKYTSSILAPNQSKVVVGVASVFQNIQARVFPLIPCAFDFLRSQKYAVDSIFQNLRISSYRWKCKAEFDKFFSVFANIWVSGKGILDAKSSQHITKRN